MTKKSERIALLETKVAKLEKSLNELLFPNTARFERESAEMDGILADIKRKARTPNEQRAYVIKRAKAFVADRSPYYKSNGLISLDFVVNSEKRTVVAITRGIHSKGVYAKGIAKCDPDDVFNADIGKAIALARALGVEVPTEFVKVVQPTEVVVGMTVNALDYDTRKVVITYTVDSFTEKGCPRNVSGSYGSIYEIADDTDAVYE